MKAWRDLAGGAVLVVVGVAVGVLLTRWPESGGWAQTLQEDVQGRPGQWRLLRGTMAYLAMPCLLIAGAAVVLRVSRRSRRDALVLAAFILAANTTIQCLKHPLLWQPQALVDLDPLSGHVGVAAAVGVGSLLVSSSARAAFVAVAVVILISAVSMGVLLSGWHTLPQVLTPLIICVAWAVAIWPFLAVSQENEDRNAGRTPPLSLGPILAVTAAMGFGGTLLLAAPMTLTSSSFAVLCALTAMLVVLAAVASVGVVLACVLLQSSSQGGDISRR